MAFTFISLPLNFYTSVSGCGCGFGFEQKYWRIDGFGEKMARIGGFAYPYSPPLLKRDTERLTYKRANMRKVAQIKELSHGIVSFSGHVQNYF